jgi:two-component system nitrogen regulation sensor histidine kinase NtrY
VDYVLENMYDLFYTTKQGGSGLGLAITRKIIEDHRGSLSVQSTPGEGTTFTVQLPVQAESENWPPAQASIQGGPQL